MAATSYGDQRPSPAEAPLLRQQHPIDYANTRYSKLDQITAGNVKNLQVAWTFSTGVLRGHEGSPLVIGNMMYVHTPFPNNIFALDLNDGGKIVWKYEPKQDPSVIAVSIAARPDTIFPLIADFKAWRGWSPYETKDPAMKRSYAGAETGKGAAYAWDGNAEVGAGRMEIVEAEMPRKIAVKLDFLRPFEAHNTAIFSLIPKGEGTDVTWSMEGKCPYVGKLMSLFVDMDAMVGKDFEAGLANLKAKAEAS